MRHIVNVGLLLSFLPLAVTEVMAFLLPFSLVTTRMHIVCGAATVVLVGLHLLSRLKYFQNQLRPRAVRTSSRSIWRTPLEARFARRPRRR